jgi:hypothetical protein
VEKTKRTTVIFREGVGVTERMTILLASLSTVMLVISYTEIALWKRYSSIEIGTGSHWCKKAVVLFVSSARNA